MTIELIPADWPAPDNVVACTTTRCGGVSDGAWRSLNLAGHVGDDPRAVDENRRRLAVQLALPAQPTWLEQVHGTRVHRPGDADTCADAAFAAGPGAVCGVLTADCLPLLLCNAEGTAVAAVHAGWRGLLAGVIDEAVAAFDTHAADLRVWLGPAIGPGAFEVGDDVRGAFVARDAVVARCFVANRPGHYLADLYALARFQLSQCGVSAVYGGGLCTYADAQRFYSYRRDGVTGRMASLIWIAEDRVDDNG